MQGVPGVVGAGLESAGLAGRTISELVQVGFANHQRASLGQAFDGGGGVGRNKVG